MKCSTCVAEGLRSTATNLGSSTTLMYTNTFWDEDGLYHIHDPNTIITDISCSNGHRWTERYKKECQACKEKENNNEQ